MARWMDGTGSAGSADAAGNAYMTGYTTSTDYPHSAGAAQTAKGAGAGYDAVVTKLSPAGAVVYSTYLGGSGDDYGLAIAIDPAGNAYVTGDTASADFPLVTPLQTTLAGGFNAFVAEVNAAGSALSYSTGLGGSGFDTGYGIAVDAAGTAYVAGSTLSADFPVTAGAVQQTLSGGSDAFMLKLAWSPWLTISKTHTGSFARSQTSATYTITVANTGQAATTGEVTVTDTLPASLTGTGISGTGWTCVPGTLTCKRSDALSAGASYAPITVTVNVAASAPATVVNQAAVSGGGAPGNSASDSTTISALTFQTITFGAPATQTFGTAPFTLSATASSGLTVSFASTTTAVCTVSGVTVTLVTAGTCAITATQPGNATYVAATPVSQSFTVAQAPQTITFNQPANVTFGVAPFAVSATASSALPVTFTSTTTAICTVAGSTVTALAAGACSLTASQAGNSNYLAAPAVTQSFVVLVKPATQTITFSAPGNVTFGAAPATLTATASSGLAVSFSSNTASICTVSGSVVTFVGAGTCSLTATQPGAASAAGPTVRFHTNLGDIDVGLTQDVAPFTVANFLSYVNKGAYVNSMFHRSVPGFIIQGGGFQLVNTTIAATATDPAVRNEFKTSNTRGTIAMAKVGTDPNSATDQWFFNLANNAANLDNQNGGFTVFGNVTAGLTVMDGIAALPVYNLTAIFPTFPFTNTPLYNYVSGGLQASNLVLVGSVEQLPWFGAASPVTQTLTVSPASQTITFGALGNVGPGTAPFALTATASSGLPVSFASTTAAVCTVSGVTVTIAGPGTCSITASQAGNTSYTAAIPVTQSFTVTGTTITFGALSDVTYGVAPFAITATASSGVAVSFASTTTPVCTVSGSAVTIAGAGTCAITASLAGAPSVSQSFTVNKAAQTISFGPIGVRGLTPFTVSATANSGLAVSFNSTTTAVCTVSGSTVTPVAFGTCSLTANQAGDANYTAAAPVTQSFTVLEPVQTITFGPLSAVTYGIAPFAVTATASSGLTVSFASTTASVCTVSGSTVTVIGAGTCAITASQAGNANFTAATSVTQSFTVNQASQSIAFAPPGNHAAGTGPFTLSATAGSGLAVSFASTTTAVCTVSGSTVTPLATGTCSLTASQAGNANYLAATPVVQSFTVTQGSQTITFGALSNVTLGVAPFTITATASSGLPVSFASTTTPVCTVAGSTVTVVATGTCSITASQAGNGTFTAAPTVSQSFTVAPATSVALTVGDGLGSPGQTVEVAIQLAATGSASPTGFQADLSFDATKMTFTSGRLPAALTGIGKTLSTNTLPGGDVQFLVTGSNQTAIANRVVAYATFTLKSQFNSGSTVVTPKNCTSSDAAGNVLATPCTAGTIRVATCDINADGTTNVADVQLIINEALGVTPAVHDLNRDGAVNVADVQKVINAALGLGCVLP